MTRFFGSFAAAAFTLALAAQTLKADAPPLCPTGNAVMNGTYVLLGSGTLFGTGGGSMAYAGLVTYNGDGTGVLMSGTENLAGTVVKLTSVPATFTVNRDCTGSKTVGTGPTATHFDFVITPDGGTITFVETDAFAVTSGTAVRMSR